MSFERLPRVVKPGDRLFLNDGLVQLVVERVAGNDVHCKVAVGGELRSRKGLNFRALTLVSARSPAMTARAWNLRSTPGVDAVSQSFVRDRRGC